ncbi:MAG: fibrobacter succinogenes major paralogous domain-containing protein [Bacteroidales bacterium]
MKHVIIVFASVLFLWIALYSCDLRAQERISQKSNKEQVAPIAWLNETQGYLVDIRDSKRYKVVKIGTQTWFAENLAYKVDRSCWAYNNDESTVDSFGYLYNWETAKNVCPAGWHLPDDTEWVILADYLGGEKIAGSKMKSTAGWKYKENINTTNSSGFNALPTGRRDNKGGIFSHYGESASFWSAKPIDSFNAVSRGLHYNSEDVHYGTNSRTSGFCVRCLKDTDKH